MDELAELQALLGAVQKQESKNRLNERNCRELLLKLIEKELVTLIVTLDGNEYVTPEQLERELKDEIIVRGGRCNLTDVQPTLNVDLRHVQNRMDDILKEDPSIVFIEGEVFTQEYLDGMAEETNQVLAEAGSLRLVDLASRFNITTQFLIECIKPRMGTIVQGRMEAGMLYTPTYVERQEACVRGAFSAVTRPTAVATLQQAFNLDESLFESTIDGLIKRGRLAGTLSGKGMRASFNPASFSKAQLAAVRGFYEANGYIEYTTAEKMLVNNPKGFLSKELGASGFALRTCYASLSLVQQVTPPPAPAAIPRVLGGSDSA
jgi:hypothetical protein